MPRSRGSAVPIRKLISTFDCTVRGKAVEFGFVEDPLPERGQLRAHHLLGGSGEVVGATRINLAVDRLAELTEAQLLADEVGEEQSKVDVAGDLGGIL